jgi:hypothetical protein
MNKSIEQILGLFSITPEITGLIDEVFALEKERDNDDKRVVRRVDLKIPPASASNGLPFLAIDVYFARDKMPVDEAGMKKYLSERRLPADRLVWDYNGAGLHRLELGGRIAVYFWPKYVKAEAKNVVQAELEGLPDKITE